MVMVEGWLIPRDGAKSFYGKAKVVAGNGVLVLVSYGTPVAVWSGGVLHRTWAGWSATTMRHVRSFAATVGADVPNKAAWYAMPCEDYYTLVV